MPPLQVRVIHNLDHPNILKFMNWYETSNHIWLIVEFCTGGDLMEMKMMDKAFPEYALKVFGRDIACGLQYLHSKGYVHCDLRPANLLVSGGGIVKIGDFASAQKTKEIKPLGQRLAVRQVSCYLSPELFEEGGVFSYASDFWAIGCTLYELYTGAAPWIPTPGQTLHACLLETELPALPPTVTAPFFDLLHQLLAKDPLERLDWDQLAGHPFWKRPLERVPLAEQPAWSDYCERRLALRQREEREREKSPPSSMSGSQLAGVGGMHSPLGPPQARMAAWETPTSGAATAKLQQQQQQQQQQQRPAHSHRNAALRASSVQMIEEVLDEDEGEGGLEAGIGTLPSHPSQQIAATPMGCVGSGGANHSHPSPSHSHSNSNSANTSRSGGGGSAAPEIVAADEMVDLQSVPTGEQLTGIHPGGEGAPTHHGSPPARVLKTRLSIHSFEDDSHKAAALPVPSEQLPRIDTARVMAVTEEVAPKYLELLMHDSDTAVKPIVQNRRIEKLPEPSYVVGLLPFENYDLAQVLAMNQQELEAFLTLVYKSIGGKSRVEEKLNTLMYFEKLCSDSASANVVVNSSLMTLFVKTLKVYKTPKLKARLCILMGVAIRYATYISPEISRSGILTVLADGLKENDQSIRRASIACFGELLFYISTQNSEAEGNETWKVSSAILKKLTVALRPGDQVVQHYAAKTVENIAAHNADMVIRMMSEEMVTCLLEIFRTATIDVLRITALSALSRLAYHSPQVLCIMASRHAMDVLVSGLKSGSSRLEQPSLNLVNCGLMGQLLYEHHIHQHDSTQALRDKDNKPISYEQMEEMIGRAITDYEPLIPAVFQLVQTAPPVVKAKAILSMSLLLDRSPSWFGVVAEMKLLVHLEKLARERDAYLNSCFQRLLVAVSDAAPTVFDGVTAEVQRFAALPATAGVDITVSPFVTVLLDVMKSSVLRPRVLTRKAVTQLSVMIGCMASGKLVHCEDLSRVILLAAEAVSQHVSLLEQFAAEITSNMFPALLSLMDAPEGDTRFMGLKIFTDSLLSLLHTLHLVPPKKGAPHTPSSQVYQIIVHDLFPRYDSILVDKDPIPLYALKLLSSLVDAYPPFLQLLEKTALIGRLFSFFELDHPNNNVHNVKLIRYVVECKTIDKRIVYEQDIVVKLNEIFAYAVENHVDSFYEPVLDVLYALLYFQCSSAAGNDFEGTLQRPSSPAVCSLGSADIRDFNEPLLENLETVILLLGHSDGLICEKASHCLVLFASLSPNSVIAALSTSSGRQHWIGALEESTVLGVTVHVLKTLRTLFASDSKFVKVVQADNLAYLAVSGKEKDTDRAVSSLARDIVSLYLGN
jgi:serine/threonine-protein kinase ULK4